jgi:hypothetical protein
VHVSGYHADIGSIGFHFADSSEFVTLAATPIESVHYKPLTFLWYTERAGKFV